LGIRYRDNALLKSKPDRSSIESLLVPKGVSLEQLLSKMGPDEAKNLQTLMEALDKGERQFQLALDRIYGPKFETHILPNGVVGIYFPPDPPVTNQTPKTRS
jgi:hypothetical protein